MFGLGGSASSGDPPKAGPDDEPKCPVDHNNPEIVAKFLGKDIPHPGSVDPAAVASAVASASSKDRAPANTATEAAAECPVDHNDPAVAAKFLGRDHLNGGEGLPPLPNIPHNLSGEREISSIPKADAEGRNWIYPSEQQFYSAMKRKQYNPNASDMPVVIPIHNAVNERCWFEILQWEDGRADKICGGPKLAKFEGDSSKLSPKARFNMLLGATRPFDRHDWTIDRCGQKIDYVIDFYSGRADPRHPERQSFYLDVRPKLNSWEGFKMRLESLWK